MVGNLFARQISTSVPTNTDASTPRTILTVLWLLIGASWVVTPSSSVCAAPIAEAVAWQSLTSSSPRFLRCKATPCGGHGYAGVNNWKENSCPGKQWLVCFPNSEKCYGLGDKDDCELPLSPGMIQTATDSTAHVTSNRPVARRYDCPAKIPLCLFSMISRSMLDACSRPQCVPSQSITCPYRVDMRTTFLFC